MWDGIDGYPVGKQVLLLFDFNHPLMTKLKSKIFLVTHGNTLCSKIKLSEVVEVIGKNAFESRNLTPVILSLEDHCCILQQQR